MHVVVGVLAYAAFLLGVVLVPDADPPTRAFLLIAIAVMIGIIVMLFYRAIDRRRD